ncbi:MAG: hypothetical protein GX945_15245 [Lentisphaerae bacterium]|jgi:hypothetical protein|nr:hypothetical protein [Lentisphaerota bacterium]
MPPPTVHFAWYRKQHQALSIPDREAADDANLPHNDNKRPERGVLNYVAAPQTSQLK